MDISQHWVASFLGWSHTGPINPPNIQLFEIVQVSVFMQQGCRAIKEACCFFFVSKFHVLDLLQNSDYGNAGKIRKLNWRAVTLGIQRQFRVINTTSCRNPKLV